MYRSSETGKPAASRQTLVTESHGITACQGSRPGGLTDRADGAVVGHDDEPVDHAIEYGSQLRVCP